ncbi:YjjG family noncanonical pyrimidine nucleotidase [Tannockella kyphosi]|uniref:YjjG family noncanonical pyrimidine nucleotidase n=1 Tax=Tannockella kyphosi TaxID=2899121 RepID=UPI00201381FB|nr:YjjG family noncanonical pyrimidine nucleotidase [Tannockella kyphosi]
MKKNYKYILWDIDDTLIDFKSSEKQAIKSCFKDFGVTLTDEDIEIYSNINHNYWELLAKQKIEKETMLNQRFEDFIQYLSLENLDCKTINTLYQERLGDYAILFKDAFELCTKFKSNKKQYAVTNGTVIAQNKKLNKTGLRELLDEVFISDEVGYQKPDIRFFQHVFHEIPDFNPEKAIMIGDSLSSDMLGANNAKIDCCWFNPNGNLNKDKAIQINYEIKELKELLKIIE